jgi:ankyrin repeat protein
VAAGADLNQCSHAGLSALHYATSGGHLLVIETLLQGGADVNLLTLPSRDLTHSHPVGATPLLLAVEDGNLTIVRTILEHSGGKCDLHKGDTKGITPLLASIKFQHPHLAEYLLAVHGADPNDSFTDDQVSGAPPLSPQTTVSCSLQGIRHSALADSVLVWRSDQLTGLLLKYGADANEIDGAGRSLLWRASSEGWLPSVQLLLTRANSTLADHRGVTPLMTSLLNHNTAIAKLLLKTQSLATLRARDSDGTDALMIAAGIGSLDLVTQLLDAGCSPRGVNVDGHSALFFASHGKSQLLHLLRTSQTASTGAAKLGEYSQIVKMLLRRGDADPSQKVLTVPLFPPHRPGLGSQRPPCSRF